MYYAVGGVGRLRAGWDKTNRQPAKVCKQVEKIQYII